MEHSMSSCSAGSPIHGSPTLLHRTETISSAVDAAIALVERARRKQIESMVGVLDACDSLFAHVTVPSLSSSALPSTGAAIVTPFISALEKRISFHRGQLAFGELLLSHHASGVVNSGAGGDDEAYDLSVDSTRIIQACAPPAARERHPTERRTVKPSTDGQLKPSKGARSSGAGGDGGRVLAGVKLKQGDMHHYPFESPSVYQNLRQRFNVSHEKIATRGSGRSTQPISGGESLLDSHAYSHRTAVDATRNDLFTNKYLSGGTLSFMDVGIDSTPVEPPRRRHDTLFDPRNNSYARENLTAVHHRAAAMSRHEAREASLSPPSTLTSADYAADYILPHHSCCALDVDLWRVRTMMHEIEGSLSDVEREYDIALEECMRVTCTAREESQSRSLLEAMFFASMPTQKFCKQVCARVHKMEQCLAVDRTQVANLEAKVQQMSMAKDRYVQEAAESSRTMMAQVRDLIDQERHKAYELVSGIIDVTQEVVEEGEARERFFVSQLEEVARANVVHTFASLNAAGWSHRLQATSSLPPFAPSARRISTTSLVDAFTIVNNTMRLESVIEYAIAMQSTASAQAATQTDESGAGRWLTAAEERRLRSVWFTRNETYATLTTAFIFHLEDSERERILGAEDDTFSRETASWNATAQHYRNLKEMANKDAKIAALQMDLAGLRSSTMASRSGSVAATDGGSVASPHGAFFRPRFARPSLPAGALVPSVYDFHHDGAYDSSLHRSKHSNDNGIPEQEPRSTRSLPLNPSPKLLPNARSFYGAVRSVSPTNMSDVPSSTVSRSASVRGSFLNALQPSFGGFVESLTSMREDDHSRDQGVGPAPISSAASANKWTPDGGSLLPPLQGSLSRVASSRTLAPVTMPDVNFPSVPIVVSMAITLEDLSREDIERKEFLRWKEIILIEDDEHRLIF